MAPYRFGPRTEANARGVVDFDDPLRTAWAAHVVNEGFSYWRLTAAQAQANLVFTNKNTNRGVTGKSTRLSVVRCFSYCHARALAPLFQGRSE